MGWLRTPLSLAISSVVLVACAVENAEDDGDTSSAEAVSTSDPAYPTNAVHSTLTPAIVSKLKTVLAGAETPRDTHRFIKVGDSITFSTSFLDCLATKSAPSTELESTRTYFEGSWDRVTKSAVVGWHTLQPITGSPSPLDTEVSAMNPAFAVVMLGTNDNDPSQLGGAYRANLEKVVDTLLEKNIVPLLSTIPPRGNSASADARVPAMNAIVRFVAAERQIPLMDFHLALQGLPGKGLGPDGIHPNAASTGACDFSEKGLTHGYNVRNELVLEALDQVRTALLDGTDAEPAEAPAAVVADPAASGPISDSTLTAVDDYTVLASALHCRSAAGTDQSIIETVPRGGSLVAIADSDDAPREEMDSAGVPWLHVTTPSGEQCYVEADASLIHPVF